MNRDDRHLDPVVGGDAEPAPTVPPERPKSLRAFTHLLPFAAAFAGVTALLVPSFPEDDILRAKLAHLDAHAEEYDGVFLGSSRVYRAFDPDVFERETGLAVFNLGLLYGRPHELDTLLRELLRAHRLPWVFVEVMDWAPSINADLADQDRTLRWHTPRQTLSAIRTTWRAEGTTLGKLWTSGRHVGHLVKRSVNFGGGVPRLRAWFDDGARHRAWLEVVARGRGFVRYEQETDPRYERERRAFLEKYVDDYLRQVATVDAANREPGSLEHFNTRAQREQREFIEQHGAEAIHVVPNLRRGTPDWHRLEDAGIVDTLLEFNHVERYPELYALEHVFDRRHLNTEGARHFTRLLAERFEESRQPR